MQALIKSKKQRAVNANEYLPKKISKSKNQKVYCGYLDKEFESMKSCAKYLGIQASKLTLQVQGKVPNIYEVKKII